MSDEEDFSQADISEGKALGMMCYIPCCFNVFAVFVAFLNKNNDFHCFHARQGLGVLIGWGAVGIIGTFGAIILPYVWILGVLAIVFNLLVIAAVLGISGLGLFNASLDEYRPLPVVGDNFTKWFKFIHKAKSSLQ